MSLSAAPREGKLVFNAIPSDEFSFLVANQGRSDEIGPVTSQYQNELKHKSDSVGTLGFFACNRLVGALSYCVLNLPRDLNSVAGRLDVVVTETDCRGNGVAALMIAKLFDTFLKKYGKNLKEISTVAAHPAVVACVSKLGFIAPPKLSKTARYYIAFETQAEIESFGKKVDVELLTRFQSIKAKCIRCQHKSWATPWCRDTKKGYK